MAVLLGGALVWRRQRSRSPAIQEPAAVPEAEPATEPTPVEATAELEEEAPAEVPLSDDGIPVHFEGILRTSQRDGQRVLELGPSQTEAAEEVEQKAKEKPKPKAQDEMVEELTSREKEMLSLLAQGYTYREIGRQMGITYNTVKTYAYRIYSKLGVNDRDKAIKKARELGLLEVN